MHLRQCFLDIFEVFPENFNSKALLEKNNSMFLKNDIHLNKILNFQNCFRRWQKNPAKIVKNDP
jgi:hypothetical protein